MGFQPSPWISREILPHAIGPPIARPDLGRHQSDVIHVGRAANIDDVGNICEIHIVVALDEHDALGAVGIDLGQLGQQGRAWR
jgi:hypothetical protein